MNLTQTQQRRWIPPKNNKEPDQRFCMTLGITPLLARVLYSRGFRDLDRAKSFLRPALKELHDPKLLPNMADGAKRLCTAIENKDPILLFGDYDVDGITGCAVLGRVLQALGGTVVSHIPNRFSDGYGLQVIPLQRHLDGDTPPRVVVTIDNGVVAFEAAEFLANSNVDLIVADHHRMHDRNLPIARAIIHPKLPGSVYPNKNLCGAGVAFKLAWATACQFTGNKKLPAKLRDLLLESMSLVAMGTVADVMPLTEENRTFVKYGLQALESGPTPGLYALLQVSKVKRPLNAATISFGLAPRINAAGRLGSGSRALDLLNNNNDQQSIELAKVLDKENDERREIEKELAEQAKTQVNTLYGENPRSAGLVVADHNWHEGVVGIVASRLVDTFHRPSIVLAILEDGIHAKGSGRGILNVDLKAALDDCAHLLTRYGGHEAAVGLSLEAKNIDEFRQEFARAIAKQMGIAKGVEVDVEAPPLRLDAEVRFAELSQNFVGQLELLEPHGYGNRRPVFSTTVKIVGAPKLMGKNSQHLSFLARQDERTFRAIIWSGAEHFDELAERASGPASSRRPFRIAFQPQFNDFRGKRSVQLIIKDIRFDNTP